ncbi:MAG: hypothetical protein WD317_09180 [Balneolaceae bacterium]
MKYSSMENRLISLGLMTLLFTLFSGWSMLADQADSGLWVGAVMGVTVFVIVSFIVKVEEIK